MLLVMAVGMGQLEQVRMGDQRTIWIWRRIEAAACIDCWIAGGQDLGLGTTID